MGSTSDNIQHCLVSLHRCALLCIVISVTNILTWWKVKVKVKSEDITYVFKTQKEEVNHLKMFTHAQFTKQQTRNMIYSHSQLCGCLTIIQTTRFNKFFDLLSIYHYWICISIKKHIQILYHSAICFSKRLKWAMNIVFRNVHFIR